MAESKLLPLCICTSGILFLLLFLFLLPLLSDFLGICISCSSLVLVFLVELLLFFGLLVRGHAFLDHTLSMSLVLLLALLFFSLSLLFFPLLFLGFPLIRHLACPVHHRVHGCSISADPCTDSLARANLKVLDTFPNALVGRQLLNVPGWFFWPFGWVFFVLLLFSAKVYE